MAKATEVFTPTDVPTITYVERTSKNFEDELRRAFTIPKMIVSNSGPSKSGKTVLVTKVVAPENLIHIYGATIKKPDDLWQNVITWMGGPVSRTTTTGSTIGADISGTAGGKVGIPLVAEGKLDLKGGASGALSRSSTELYAQVGVEDIVREIGNSDYVVFIDDFHYIEKTVRDEIGRQIKAAAERGVRICTASVPHRADDVVRSNTELRGRVTAIDMSYWEQSELQQIADRGFRELNVDLAPNVVGALAAEAFGSPQLMQAICLSLCFDFGISETLPSQQRKEIDQQTIDKVFERASVTTDFSTMLNALHSGPKLRGTERKPFKFNDGSEGDVYRCVLLAIKADPSKLSFRYDEMLRRTREVCVGDSPVGSSVAESLAQMGKLAKAVQEAPVIEWDEDVLDIVEPYFLFFLRSSAHLVRLGHKEPK